MTFPRRYQALRADTIRELNEVLKKLYEGRHDLVDVKLLVAGYLVLYHVSPGYEPLELTSQGRMCDAQAE